MNLPVLLCTLLLIPLPLTISVLNTPWLRGSSDCGIGPGWSLEKTSQWNAPCLEYLWRDACHPTGGIHGIRQPGQRERFEAEIEPALEHHPFPAEAAAGKFG